MTAPYLLGNIDATAGPITNTVESTVGDIGRVLTDSNGNITGVTSLHALGGMTAGSQIISRGNLVSLVRMDNTMAGVIAVQKDFGAIKLNSSGNAVVGTDAAASLTRFGGLTANSGVTGQVVVLGNLFGDVSISGSLDGRIAVKGQVEYGLPAYRYGILGNVNINGGMGTAGALVSAA